MGNENGWTDAQVCRTTVFFFLSFIYSKRILKMFQFHSYLNYPHKIQGFFFLKFCQIELNLISEPGDKGGSVRSRSSLNGLSSRNGVNGAGDEENNIHRILHQPDVDYELPASNSSYAGIYLYIEYVDSSTHLVVIWPSCNSLPSASRQIMCKQKQKHKRIL